MGNSHRPMKRRYKKLAAALAGMACLSALAIHGVPAGGGLALPAGKALDKPEVPIAAPVDPLTGPAQPEPIPERAGEDVPAPPTAAPVPPPPPDKPATAKTAPEAGARQVLEMTATAYAPGPHDNGPWGTKTHLGTEVRPGVIAVDPRIIPLGSRVMIKYPNGTTEYAVAEDTGGAIKGHRIDVAKWTVAEAYRFGIKPVQVYVLETPSGRNKQKI